MFIHSPVCGTLWLFLVFGLGAAVNMCLLEQLWDGMSDISHILGLDVQVFAWTCAFFLFGQYLGVEWARNHWFSKVNALFSIPINKNSSQSTSLSAAQCGQSLVVASLVEMQWCFTVA